MKKLRGACVLLAAGVALERMVDGVSPAAVAAAAGGPGGGDVPSENGDVNGDGRINVSDAVYLLEHLFRGGPAVKPIECPPMPPVGLPDTGQSKCYGFVENQMWIEVPCDDAAACQGQDATYTTGCPTDERFVDNGDGTVSDACTGLMWQKDTADVNADGQSTDQDYTPWCNALAFCEELSFAGHDDWRLPNVRELQSIVDYGRVGPSIDLMFGASSSWYWSSTSYAVYPVGAWVVNFNYGYVGFDEEGDVNGSVRAVRRGP